MCVYSTWGCFWPTKRKFSQKSLKIFQVTISLNNAITVLSMQKAGQGDTRDRSIPGRRAAVTPPSHYVAQWALSLWDPPAAATAIHTWASTSCSCSWQESWKQVQEGGGSAQYCCCPWLTQMLREPHGHSCPAPAWDCGDQMLGVLGQQQQAVPSYCTCSSRIPSQAWGLQPCLTLIPPSSRAAVQVTSATLPFFLNPGSTYGQLLSKVPPCPADLCLIQLTKPLYSWFSHMYT